MKTVLISILAFALFGGQSEIKLNEEKSQMKISGTSSIHDWESEVNDFSVKGKLSDDKITNLEVMVQAKSIESGKSIMNDKTYEALKTEKYPVIQFKADQLNVTGNKVVGKGTLSLAGKTKPIDIEANIVSKKGDEMQLQGAVDLKMTDFGIDPPTAMFGSISTGDEVTIKYDIFLTNI